MNAATLNIMTLNTWGFRWPLAKDRDVRFARIREHLVANQYDAVTMQELWGTSPTALEDDGLDWAWDDKAMPRGLRRNDSGLGIKLRGGLSRGAGAIKRAAHAFKRAAGFDRLKAKGFHMADLHTAAHGPVTLVNTHLQAGERAGGIRRHQLDELLLTLDPITGPIILCGDFNLFSGSHEDRAAHKALNLAGFLDASESIDRPDPTYLTTNRYVPPSEGNQRFDRIYVRDGMHDGRRVHLVPTEVRVIVDQHAPLSDHEGLAASIEVRVA